MRCLLRLIGFLVFLPGLGAAAAPPFHADRLEVMEGKSRAAIAAGRTPGMVLWLERNDAIWNTALGSRSIRPSREPLSKDTIYDAASLTKVVATTTAVLILADRGKLRLDDPVARHLTEFAVSDKKRITIRQLLTHHSGLKPGLVFNGEWTGTAKALQLACTQPVSSPPGERHIYSDINFILLALLVERVSGVPFDRFCEREIFKPLGMVDTGFRRFDPAAKPLPLTKDHSRTAPTELLADGTILRGIVHDPTARRMGGVAGHAGLFLTATDLARFCRMLLNGGSLGKARILKPETVALMTSVQSPAGSVRRGLGWDIDSSFAGQRGEHFPIGGFGHTGWTGPSLWIDPFSRTFFIMLTNRNHPRGNTSVLELRNELATLAAEAVTGFNFLHVPGALDAVKPLPAKAATRSQRPVLNGIDVLVRDGFQQLDGLKIGLVTNASGHDRQRRSTIDLLKQAPGVKLLSLFSPEHGIRGDLDQAKIADGRDERSGLPVHSLYGERRSPTPEQLKGLDALVFDIQDVGCRFYTYLSTLTHCMEAAAAAKIRFIVLDRVNPIGGRVEGPVHSEARSFVGIHEIPLRHGMTLGELALLIDAERRFGCDLSVIACEGGSPLCWFDESGQPWSNPSPNLRSPAAALLYPGVGILEFCKLSVGRGTDTPFEVLGAPWIDELKLADSLNAAGLPGIRFTPIRFTPASSVFAGEQCRGVRLTVTNRDDFRAADLGMWLASTLHQMAPKQLNLEAAIKLLGDRPTLDALRGGRPPGEIPKLWQDGLIGFEKRRKPHLLYPRDS
jgi:uncharacterized protein YbbC (DUF1343 family)/CubicO group peptidase (beta-lactamase class C family)